MKKVITCILAIGIPLLIGVIGSIFTQESVSTWYLTLEKPSFNPPNYLFPIAWTYLYITMGFASWLVWLKRDTGSYSRNGLIFYSIQLFFNMMWSYLFFTLQNPGLALIEILILLPLIIITTFYFFKTDRIAGWLMIPYIAWVSFATVLNASIYWLN